MNNPYLIWIDLEMTGLNPSHDRIIEMATVITDNALNIIAEGPELVVHQSDNLLDTMDQWNCQHHAQSGLTQRVRASALTEQQAEQITMDFLSKHLSAGQSPMCGNSICQDRRFLVNYMPKLANFFHYRQIDVSTIKELARRWQPTLQFCKKSGHRALDDVYLSIDELRYYRQHWLK